ncbi:hypothetical protein F4777DRAFT_548608 [Nemania sp. FL0916]|nr:hypothetical protein F4777DRAFT_548608 [Nemania sp. FL0916]
MEAETKLLFNSRKAPKNSVMIDIHLVHGFLGTKYSYYRDVLEDWVSNMALSSVKSENSIRIAYAYRFHGSSIPETGKSGLEKAVLKLRQNVLGELHQRSTDEALPDLGSVNDSLHPQRTVPDPSQRLPGNAIIFIGHGLGAWVVKDALAHPSSDSITYSFGNLLVGFINLDIREEPREEHGDDYERYLDRNWKHFLGLPGLAGSYRGNKVDELVVYLRQIDENFNIFKMSNKASDTINWHRNTWIIRQMIYRGRDEIIWMSKSRSSSVGGLSHAILFVTKLITVQQPARRSRSPIPLFKKQTQQVQDEAIRRLPSFEDIQQLLRSNAVETDLSEISSQLRERIGATESDTLALYEKANIYLQIGELHDAEQLFTALSNDSNLSADSPVKLHLDMQVVTVKMYSGDYMHSRMELLNISTRLKEYLKHNRNETWAIEHQALCRQRLAHCWLLAGQWNKAATEMKSLLDENSNIYNVELRRDLALAYAYLGRFSEARGSLKNLQRQMGKGKTKLSRVGTTEEIENQGGKQNSEFQIKEGSVTMASATVDMLAGNYYAALAQSSDALESMKKMMGAKHFKTLAAATLKAWCLAYNGKYVEAETLCLTTYKATTQSLGRLHPQALEAMGCLVYIFQCQGRFAEAIGTGVSLRDLLTLTSQQNTDHGIIYPQSVHSKFSLAKAFIANGEYATARQMMDEVVHEAEQIMETKHPDIVRYKTEQARALLYLGHTEKAEGLALSVAAEQLKLYARVQDTDSDVTDSCTALQNGPREESLSRIDSMLNKMLEDSTTTLHPYLVSNFQLLANIEVHKYRLSGRKGGSANLAAARSILLTLQNYSSDTASRDIVSTASIDLDLATLYKEQPTDVGDLSKAVELFTQAYEAKKSCMENNIDTLCVLRELTIAQCLPYLSNPEAGDNLISQSVKAVSTSILKTLESRLGPAHPETLTSQLWYLTVDHLNPDNDRGSIERIMADLIGNLSEPRLAKERFIESMVMRRQLATFLKITDRHEKAIELADAAILKLDEAAEKSEDSVWTETLQDLRMTFVEVKEATDEDT